MNNLNHKDVGGTEHVSRAKDPAIVEESQKPISWQCRVPRLIAVALCVIFVVVLVRDHIKKAEAKAEAAKVVAAQKATNTPTASSVEALVLAFEGVTPCSTQIAYRAQIWGDGPDFWVQFPGVKDPVLYGRGKFTAPSGVETGETFFKAVDPAKPVVIQVYKKVTVQK